MSPKNNSDSKTGSPNPASNTESADSGTAKQVDNQFHLSTDGNQGDANRGPLVDQDATPKASKRFNITGSRFGSEMADRGVQDASRTPTQARNREVGVSQLTRDGETHTGTSRHVHLDLNSAPDDFILEGPLPVPEVLSFSTTNVSASTPHELPRHFGSNRHDPNLISDWNEAAINFRGPRYRNFFDSNLKKRDHQHHQRYFKIPAQVGFAELAHANPPAVRNIYKDGALASTRGPCNTEINYEDYDVMSKIVFVPFLVEQMIPDANTLLQSFVIDTNDKCSMAFLHEVHPSFTARGLPPRIYAEFDTQMWVFRVLCHPAIALARAVLNGGDFCFDDEKLHIAPFLSSVPAVHTIRADGQFVVNNLNPADEDSLGSKVLQQCRNGIPIEIKTQNTFIYSPDIAVYPSFKSIMVTTFEENERPQLKTWNKAPAMKFHWPESENDEGFSAQENDKVNRILLQVWSEMTQQKTRQAILSSYEYTVFFIRRGDTLYMSPVYTTRDYPILAYFAFIAFGLGLIKEEILHLPDPDTSHWSLDVFNRRQRDRSGRVQYAPSGLDLRTIPALCNSRTVMEQY